MHGEVVGAKSDLVSVEPKGLNIEDDKRMRYLARKAAIKDLEVLKACKVVVEKLEFLTKESKPRMKENKLWSEEFKRKFGVWKVTNGRFLNLKESKQKEAAKENTLLDFCQGKGLLRQKESWETSLETIPIMKERRVKEIYEKLKLYKTKKKKL